MTAIGVIIMIPAVIVLGAILITSITRASQRAKAHDRCSYCRARLKKAPGGTFATTCAKCGRTQPWALR